MFVHRCRLCQCKCRGNALNSREQQAALSQRVCPRGEPGPRGPCEFGDGWDSCTFKTCIIKAVPDYLSFPGPKWGTAWSFRADETPQHEADHRAWKVGEVSYYGLPKIESEGKARGQTQALSGLGPEGCSQLLLSRIEHTHWGCWGESHSLQPSPREKGYTWGTALYLHTGQ